MRIPGLNQTVKWLTLRQYYLLQKQIERPLEVQADVLKSLLARASNTKFAIEHGFQHVKTYQEFIKKAPVQHYDMVKPYIQRMMHGEENVLVPGKVEWFAKSSGTTNDKSKFIPVPKRNLNKNHYLGAWQAAGSVFHLKPQTKAFNGKQLIMGGSHQALQTHPSTHFGDVSAILLEHMPTIMAVAYTPDIKTALMANTDEKLERMALQVAKEDVRTVSGAPTWMTVLFRMILAQTGKKNLLEVWPNLEVINHGGMSFGPYRDQFKQMIPSDDLLYVDIYNASEGYFSFQDHNFPGDAHIVLPGNDIFIELLPASEWDELQPRAIPLQDAEIDTVYAPIISSSAGLWRYLTGDTVKIVNTKPFQWQIVGRMREYINVFGEEVMVSDTDKALQEVCKHMHSTIHQYTVAPVFFQGNNGQGGHEWVIEFEQAPIDIEQFCNLLDQKLQQINSDYEAKRYKNLALNRLRLNVVPRGTFNNWLKIKGRYGFQNKVPRLSNQRQIVDEILALTL